MGLRQIGSYLAFFFDDVTIGIDNIHSVSPPSSDFSPEIARSSWQKSTAFNLA
jgi:hypothetical protein